MKKLGIVFLLSLVVAAFASAQEYKTFKVGMGLGYASPLAGKESPSVGDLLALELGYRITDEVAIGMRYENAILVDYDFYATDFDSYSLNGQYYIGHTKFRPFVGAGVGWFRVWEIDYATSAISKIGFYPRIGFDVGHFNMTLDYNVMGTSNGSIYEISDNYLGIRIGGFFGGGKKRTT